MLLPASWRISFLRCALLLACGACASAPGVEAESPKPVAPAARKKKAPLPRDVVERSALPLSARTATGELDESSLLDELEKQRAVCFGEQHDDPHHHYAQWKLLLELARRARASERPLAIGLEMFQQPFQTALSSYVRGESTEAELIAGAEYEGRWGFDFSLYRPLLDVAREAELEALALNAPRELTRQIARVGLAGLSDQERAALPELSLDDEVHRAYFDAAMGAHPMPPGGPSADDMYAAQVTWDESMATRAGQWLSEQGEAGQLIIFAGSGHCHERAIPARVQRRTGVDVLSVTPVLASELADFEHRERYDVLVVLDDSVSESPRARR